MSKQFETKAVTPVISVVLPVYNSDKYLREAVESILSQTFNNFELIVINDGSTDDSLGILKEFKKLDERVRLVSRGNRGIPATLNEGISIARGEWIAIMNADDIALPNRLERQLQWLEQTGSDICGSWVKFFGTAERRILKHPQTDAAIKMGLMFGSMFAQPSVMMRTDLVKKLQYDKNWKVAEDYDLWERAMRAGWKMTNVPEVLLLYRQHNEQISVSTFSYQQQLTQNIRRRCLEFVFESMSLRKDWLDEILKLREPSPPAVNMDAVGLIFTELLKRTEGEARATIFDHMTRLYYRVAAQCPDALQRWGRLNDEFGTDFSLGVRIRIWLLSKLRIRPGSEFFARMKSLYLGSEQ